MVLLPTDLVSAVIRTPKPTLTSMASSPLSETHWVTRRTQYVLLAYYSGLVLPLTELQGFTAVGGTNWIDVDTVQFNKSLILTFNYAYGGATINASLVAPYEPTVLSLGDQVNQFLTTAASKPSFAPWTSSNALFSFWIGINDIGNSYYQSGDRGAYV